MNCVNSITWKITRLAYIKKYEYFRYEEYIIGLLPHVSTSHKQCLFSIFAWRPRWEQNGSRILPLILSLNPSYGKGVLDVVTSAGGLTLWLVLLIMKGENNVSSSPCSNIDSSLTIPLERYIEVIQPNSATVKSKHTYFKYNQQDAALYNILHYCQCPTCYVSGGFSAHHQELKNCTHSMCQASLLLPLAVAAS